MKLIIILCIFALILNTVMGGRRSGKGETSNPNKSGKGKKEDNSSKKNPQTSKALMIFDPQTVNSGRSDSSVSQKHKGEKKSDKESIRRGKKPISEGTTSGEQSPSKSSDGSGKNRPPKPAKSKNDQKPELDAGGSSRKKSSLLRKSKSEPTYSYSVSPSGSTSADASDSSSQEPDNTDISFADLSIRKEYVIECPPEYFDLELKDENVSINKFNKMCGLCCKPRGQDSSIDNRSNKIQVPHPKMNLSGLTYTFKFKTDDRFYVEAAMRENGSEWMNLCCGKKGNYKKIIDNIVGKQRIVPPKDVPKYIKDITRKINLLTRDFDEFFIKNPAYGISYSHFKDYFLEEIENAAGLLKSRYDELDEDDPLRTNIEQICVDIHVNLLKMWAPFYERRDKRLGSPAFIRDRG